MNCLRKPLSRIVFAAGLVALSSLAAAEEWPNFLGPNHNACSAESGLKTDWTDALPLVWERNVGPAFSSFACVDGRVFTCGTVEKEIVLFCLAADTGKVIWQKVIEPEYQERMGGDGARATPTIDEGRLYFLSPKGRVVCLRADDGDPVWDAKIGFIPTWGCSASILIEGDLAIVAAGKEDGGLVAFDKKDGRRRWSAGDDIGGYATPYPFTFEGKRYVVGFLGKTIIIVRPEDGKVVFSLPWNTDYDVNAAAPIYHDGHLLLSSGYRHGAILIKLRATSEGLDGEKVWENRNLRLKFQSGVLHDGNVYAADEKALKCVDFMTGEIKWEADGVKDSTLLLAQGHLFIQSEKGQLIIAPAKADKFEPGTRADILDGRCWSLPVIYRGNIYSRNTERVVCFRLMP